MPSLYRHEQLSTGYTELSDGTLLAYSVELEEMRKNTEIPRQLGVISLLLNRIAFEMSCRVSELEPSVI